jgi:small subunit ribosomal protein S8
MTVSDPISDMLTRIRNANLAFKPSVVVSHSKQKRAIAEILKKEGYIKDFKITKAPKGPGSIIEIELKFQGKRQRVIEGLERVSRPGLRVYARATEVPRVLGGLGIAIISTSKGMMTDKQARANKIGGEIICYIW